MSVVALYANLTEEKFIDMIENKIVDDQMDSELTLTFVMFVMIVLCAKHAHVLNISVVGMISYH